MHTPSGGIASTQSGDPSHSKAGSDHGPGNDGAGLLAPDSKGSAKDEDRANADDGGDLGLGRRAPRERPPSLRERIAEHALDEDAPSDVEAALHRLDLELVLCVRLAPRRARLAKVPRVVEGRDQTALAREMDVRIDDLLQRRQTPLIAAAAPAHDRLRRRRRSTPAASGGFDFGWPMPMAMVATCTCTHENKHCIGNIPPYGDAGVED